MEELGKTAWVNLFLSIGEPELQGESMTEYARKRSITDEEAHKGF